MVRYKTVEPFSRESGYTPDAIRTKIRDGKWPKHLVWRKAPDGRILIDVEGYCSWVTREEQLAILAAARGETWPQLQFSFWTGLRPSELIALEWGDIDWIAGEIRIVRAKTRDAKEPESTKTLAGRRTVKLLAPAREALLKQKELTFLAGGRVFLNTITGEP